MKIPKMATKRVQDLKDYLYCLEDALGRFSEGEEARLKDILTNLRTLVRNADRKGEGLIIEISRLAGVQDKLFVTFPAKEGIPKTNPLSQAQTVRFLDYLNEVAFTNGTRQYTVQDFVWNYSNTDGSHSDPGLWSELALGEQFVIFGHNPNLHAILAIGRTVLSVGKSLLTLIPS